jgi:hypothetical protein
MITRVRNSRCDEIEELEREDPKSSKGGTFGRKMVVGRG